MAKTTAHIKRKAEQLKIEIYTLYLAYKDPRVSWYAKAFAACVVAYALSPVDLIPDFIPVLGYLDDLILLPLGIGLALKMIPPAILTEHRAKAQERFHADQPKSLVAAGVVIAVWLILLGWSVAGIIWFLDRPAS